MQFQQMIRPGFVVLGILVGANIASAQHSDIEVFNDNGTLLIHGGPIFEAEFGDEGAAFNTINPGFATEPDEAVGEGYAGLPDGELISFNIVGDLLFWDGSAFVPVPANHFVRVQQGSLASVQRDVDGSSGFQAGFVFAEEGQATGGAQATPEPGGLHAHLTFEHLKDDGGLAPGTAVGAYLLTLQLTGSTLADSQAFGIFFDAGLGEGTAAFENGVAAASALVPEPTSLALLVIGAVGAMRRRR